MIVKVSQDKEHWPKESHRVHIGNRKKEIASKRSNAYVKDSYVDARLKRLKETIEKYQSIEYL